MTDTRQALAAKLSSLASYLEKFSDPGINTPDWTVIRRALVYCEDLRAALSAQPVAGAVAEPSVCGLTECKNKTKCDRCKAWDSMGI